MKIYKIALSFLIALFLSACGSEENLNVVNDNFKTGEEITLSSVMGSSITLVRTEKGFVIKGDEDKVIMIDIFGTFCEPCKKEAANLMDFQLKNADDFVLIGFSYYEDVTDEYIVDMFSSKYNAYYFIVNDKRRDKIVDTISQDIDYKQKIQLPFKVMLKNGEYQQITDIYEGNPDNKFYLGEIPINIMQEDLDRIKKQ